MRVKDKGYLWGLALFVVGAASLADHICYDVDKFPVSAVVMGIGFVLICRSYKR
jgi:hypothetical protein